MTVKQHNHLPVEDENKNNEWKDVDQAKTLKALCLTCTTSTHVVRRGWLAEKIQGKNGGWFFISRKWKETMERKRSEKKEYG